MLSFRCFIFFFHLWLHHTGTSLFCGKLKIPGANKLFTGAINAAAYAVVGENKSDQQHALHLSCVFFRHGTVCIAGIVVVICKCRGRCVHISSPENKGHFREMSLLACRARRFSSHVQHTTRLSPVEHEQPSLSETQAKYLKSGPLQILGVGRREYPRWHAHPA